MHSMSGSFELGEQMFLEFVDRVNVIPRSSLAHSGDRIERLRDHLMQQLPQLRH